MEKACRAAAVASFSHAIPQLRQPQLRVSKPHIPDELQFLRHVLARRVLRMAGASRSATVSLHPGIFPGSRYDRTLLYFKLCYTLFHEGCGLLSTQLICVTTRLQPIWLHPFLFTCPSFILILHLGYLKNSTLICPLPNGLL